MSTRNYDKQFTWHQKISLKIKRKYLNKMKRKNKILNEM